MFILDLFAALAVAVLSGMGVGSGGLLVVYLTLVRGVEQPVAQTMNLLFFLFASGSALIVHRKKRRTETRPLLLILCGGLPGAILGGILSDRVSSETLRTIFGIFLLLSAGAVLLKTLRKWGKTAREQN